MKRHVKFDFDLMKREYWSIKPAPLKNNMVWSDSLCEFNLLFTKMKFANLK